jgi:hypothetical protein
LYDNDIVTRGWANGMNAGNVKIWRRYAFGKYVLGIPRRYDTR